MTQEQIDNLIAEREAAAYEEGKYDGFEEGYRDGYEDGKSECAEE